MGLKLASWCCGRAPEAFSSSVRRPCGETLGLPYEDWKWWMNTSSDSLWPWTARFATLHFCSSTGYTSSPMMMIMSVRSGSSLKLRAVRYRLLCSASESCGMCFICAESWASRTLGSTNYHSWWGNWANSYFRAGHSSSCPFVAHCFRSYILNCRRQNMGPGIRESDLAHFTLLMNTTQR